VTYEVHSLSFVNNFNYFSIREFCRSRKKGLEKKALIVGMERDIVLPIFTFDFYS